MNHLQGVLTVVTTCILLACPVFAEPTTSDSSEAMSPPSLTGITWNLISMRGGIVGNEVPATIHFEEDGSLGGHDGCNAYRGSYSLDGSNIRIAEDRLATRMMCPEPLAGRVLAYTVALSKASNYAIEDGKLRLKAKGGSTVAMFESESGELDGSSWIVTAYNNGQQAVVSVLIGSEITAQFADEEKITGQAGCNNYFASCRVDGEEISIGQPGSTRKFCAEPEGIMEQESLFLTALQSAATYKITGEKMELRTSKGSLAATLVRTKREK
jgi:heat shock protein HslJ